IDSLEPRLLFAETSSLWGTAGELFDPAGRLTDFSYAGYHNGEAPLPTTFSKEIDVTKFGATPDDAIDDTTAFQKAIKSARKGSGKFRGHVTVTIPAGTFVISDVLRIQKSGIV